MKAVLISINKPHTDNIKALIKKVEVRKNKPNCELPFKSFIYETKRKGGCGKVIGEFICDKIYRIKNLDTRFLIDNDERLTNEIANVSCLYFKDMKNYLGSKDGYAWHITDLVIYDEPKLLEKFFKPCGDCDKKGTMRCTEEITPCRATKITRPPQSWCYVEEMGV